MNKVSIITGATSGIGLEIAKLVAREDTDILIISSNEKNLIKTKEILKKISIKSIEYIKLDLSNNSKENYEVIKREVKDREILYVINNAGFGDFGKFENVNMDKQESMIKLNILTLTYISKLYLDLTKDLKDDSYLLNVGSVASYMPGPLMSVYYATKAYVLQFTRAIRFENDNKNRTISTLCPGPTATNFIKSSNLEDSTLFDSIGTMTSRRVAKIAFKGLKSGKKEIVPGLLNNIMLFAVKISPNFIVEYCVNSIMKHKKN